MSGGAARIGDWDLWPDFAVRSAGFPVTGLDAFGPGDESARLREVARDPLFREAVTWQNAAALANAVIKVAEGSPTKPSRARLREEVVASYWQRYCGKTDTIGFFGPLAWGRIVPEGPPLTLRAGGLVREREVHFEAWPIQALAETLDPAIIVPTCPHPEKELRATLDAHPDADVRRRGLAALDLLEEALARVAAAPREGLVAALAALDATFVELTGREAVRNPGRAYGARTLAYLDCTRDLDVCAGPGLLRQLEPALATVFAAGRWFCGEVQAIGRRILEEALAEAGPGPLGRLMGPVMGRLMEPPPEIGDVLREMHRRLRTLVEDPDPATAAARAEAAFTDHRPGWPSSVLMSVDVHLTTAAAGDGSGAVAVVGDVHPGGNPLAQGVFAHRHPGGQGFLSALTEAIGAGTPMLLPPFAPGLGVDARGFPVFSSGLVPVTLAPARLPGGTPTVAVPELTVEGRDVVDREGRLRAPLEAVLGMAIFVSGVRTFELLPEEEHSPRVTLGRVVLRREGWNVPASEVPQKPAELEAFARDRGMPRRLFAKSPLERKPMFLDITSPVLGRILCRHARHAAEEAPGAPIRFTEMLPAPEDCWLTDESGARYASELRFVAVDRTRARQRTLRAVRSD